MISLVATIKYSLYILHNPSCSNKKSGWSGLSELSKGANRSIYRSIISRVDKISRLSRILIFRCRQDFSCTQNSFGSPRHFILFLNDDLCIESLKMLFKRVLQGVLGIVSSLFGRVGYLLNRANFMFGEISPR